MVAAAFELFQLRGYEEATLAEIALSAGVSPRTLSNYFPLKTDLLAAYREDLLELVEQTLERRGDLPGPQRARAALLAVAGANERHPNGRLAQRLLARHASSSALQRIQERFQRAIARSLRPNELRPGVDPDLAALALAAAQIAVTQRWAAEEGTRLVPRVERLFSQWMEGVGR
jgi:AcrR family transcriptional regulator